MTLPSIATTAAAPFHLDEPLRWLPAPPLDDPPASAPQLDLIHSIVTGLHNDTGISGRGKSWRRASIISFTTCTDHSKAEQQVRVVSLITWMKGRIWVWVHLPAPGICSRSRVSIKIWDRWLRCCYAKIILDRGARISGFRTSRRLVVLYAVIPGEYECA
jgi:hypothetical protein